MKGITPILVGGLEGAVLRVAEDYSTFIARGPAPGSHDDTKAFATHHAAGKAALAHLEQLLKLARAASAGGEAGSATEAGLQRATALLLQARAAMPPTPEDEEDHDADAEDGGCG